MEEKFSKLRGLLAKSMNASPKSWRLFFKKYGYAIIPTRPEKTIVNLYCQYGDSILTDVNQILATGDMEHFLGMDKEEAGDILHDMFDIAKNITEKKTSEEKKQEVKTTTGSDEEKEVKRTKIVIGVFIGLCVVSVITFVLVRKLK